MWILPPSSEAKLAGVHPDLVRVVRHAMSLSPRAPDGTPIRFIVTEGLRTRERQAQMVAKGLSRTMNSRHLTGHAVDVAPWLDDGDGRPETPEVSWAMSLYHLLIPTFLRAAENERVRVEAGLYWRSFVDGPHLELDRRAYP